MPRLTFLLPGGRSLQVEVPPGMSVLEAARLHGVDIEGACGGSMACATCHVHVAEAWFDRLDPPSGEEEDMLDFAADLQWNSRLGCQIRLRPDLDGLVVELPASSLLSAPGAQV